jgi:transcriptional regulator with XRE-family HTH domain
MVNDMGAKIKALRMALDMTLIELGNKVGVGASTVRKWEIGYIKDMRSDKIRKVADALGVTPAYLMGWDESQNVEVGVVRANNGIIGQTNAPVTINGGASAPETKEEFELLRIYRALDVKRRIKLLTTAITLETEGRPE